VERSKQNDRSGKKEEKSIKRRSVPEDLRKSTSVFEKESETTEKERKKILRDRARVLAGQSGEIPALADSLQVLEFLLAHERYAIETEYVREVYPMKDLTVLPCTPPFLVGVINVRGEVLPVIDIRKFFDLPERGITDFNKVVIVRKDAIELGVLTDEIIGVRDIPYDSVQVAPPLLPGVSGEYLKAVTGDRLVVLEIGRLIADGQIIVHEETEP